MSARDDAQPRPWTVKVAPIKVVADPARHYLIEFDPGASGDDVVISVTQVEDGCDEFSFSIMADGARRLSEGLSNAAQIADVIAATREAAFRERESDAATAATHKAALTTAGQDSEPAAEYFDMPANGLKLAVKDEPDPDAVAKYLDDNGFFDLSAYLADQVAF